jgi:hypothetical protein
MHHWLKIFIKYSLLCVTGRATLPHALNTSAPLESIMYTTLAKIREHLPCFGVWAKLLRHLGKTQADDEPLAIVTILDSNGLDDALWCLRAVSGHDREIRLFAVWCARQVQHLLTDQCSIDAIDVAERFANGEASQQELGASWAAANAASRAANAEWDAANAAAGAAANAASLAANSASWAAANAASWAANAAGAAAWDAAWAASRDTANDALDTEWDAAIAAQEKELRAVCARIAEQVTS